MKRWIHAATIEPEFKRGDIVIKGRASGYQGTFEMTGNINEFPDDLLEFVRNIYLVDFTAEGDPIYKVEYLMDEDDLFEENYRNFLNRIFKVLKDNGFEIVD